MESIAADIRNMTVEELQGVRRICATLARAVDVLLEVADDRAQAQQAEPLAS